MARLTPGDTARLVGEIRRGAAREVRDIEVEGLVLYTSGVDGLVLEGCRGLRLSIGRRPLGRRPSFRDATVERSSFGMIKARSADFAGVTLSAVSIGGPFEAFEDCTFADCRLDGVTIRENIRFRNCTFRDSSLDLRTPDGVVFSDCRLDRVTFTGRGEISIIGSGLAECDASGFLMADGVISAVAGESDLRLPATEACFFVPRSVLEGPFAERRSHISSPLLEAKVVPLGPLGTIINAAELRRSDPTGGEAEELLAALWPHHIENLREASQANT